MQRLTGATLIDGTGTPPVPDAAILIDDEGRITAVGAQQTVPEPPEAEVIDVTGLTLLPGLIDGHDHLAHQGYGLLERCVEDAVFHVRVAASGGSAEELVAAHVGGTESYQARCRRHVVST